MKNFNLRVLLFTIFLFIGIHINATTLRDGKVIGRVTENDKVSGMKGVKLSLSDNKETIVFSEEGGAYIIKARPGTYILKATKRGYKTFGQIVEVSGGKAITVDVVMVKKKKDLKIYKEGFFKKMNNSLSTFPVSINKYSYIKIKKYIENNEFPPRKIVKIEEMINYFDYYYEKPKGENLFKVNTELFNCSWDKRKKLLKIGLQGKDNKTVDDVDIRLEFNPLVVKGYRLIGYENNNFKKESKTKEIEIKKNDNIKNRTKKKFEVNSLTLVYELTMKVNNNTDIYNDNLRYHKLIVDPKINKNELGVLKISYIDLERQYSLKKKIIYNKEVEKSSDMNFISAVIRIGMILKREYISEKDYADVLELLSKSKKKEKEELVKLIKKIKNIQEIEYQERIQKEKKEREKRIKKEKESMKMLEKKIYLEELEFENISLEELLELISKKSGVMIYVESNFKDLKIDLNLSKGQNLKKIIEMIKRTAGLRGKIVNNQVILYGYELENRKELSKEEIRFINQLEEINYPLELDFKGTPLSEALSKLSKATGVSIVAAAEIVDMKIDLYLSKGQSLKRIIDTIRTANGLSYRIVNDTMILSKERN